MKRSRLSRRSRFPRQLPIVYIGGKAFYKDDRLREYREVANPHHVIFFPFKLGDV